MLFDIKQPLEPGARVPLTLIIEQKGKKKSVEVQAEVRSVTE
jgi:copper(I)-binding protein